MRRQEELQDHGGSATAAAAQESSPPTAAHSDARATLKGALGDLIVRGNALPAAQVAFSRDYCTQ